MPHGNFLKNLYDLEALKFSLMYNFFNCFHDKSIINVFMISEKYWTLSSLSVFSGDRNSLNINKQKLLGDYLSCKSFSQPIYHMEFKLI